MSAPPMAQLAIATLGPTPWNRGDEHHVGMLRAGRLADFVVVSRDPSMTPPAALFDVQVLRTVVGGRTVFAAQ